MRKRYARAIRVGILARSLEYRLRGDHTTVLDWAAHARVVRQLDDLQWKSKKLWCLAIRAYHRTPIWTRGAGREQSGDPS